MSSSLSLIIAGVGAVAAAVGSAALLARCFRSPRADLVAWSIALLGLLVSLGCQTLGYLSGFDGAMFRAMELGGQVIAPLAVVLGMTEVAAKGLAARFCARLYLPALAIVAVVILTLDQLASVHFTKNWPSPAVYYGQPPGYVLMFGIGPVTALVALIAFGVVARRSRVPSWNALLPAQLAAGAAALLLAYPPLQQLVKYVAHYGLPIRSEFSLCCAAAAALIFVAGTKIGRLDPRVVHAGAAAADGPPPRDSWAREDAEFDGRDDFVPSAARGRGREDFPVRSGTPAPDRYRGRADWDDAPDLPGVDQTGDFARFEDWRHDSQSRASGHEPARGDDDFQVGVATGDIDVSHEEWAVPRQGDDRPARYEPDRSGRYEEELPGGYDLRRASGWHDDQGDDHYPAGTGESVRADLFGQIAIYTLLEDRVQQFDQLIERVVGDVRSREPDTLVYIVHAVPSAPLQRILYEVYRSREAYEWHRQQSYVANFEADRRPYVLATNVIELGLQQAKVSPFPSVSELFGEPGYDTSGFERPDYLRDYGRKPSGESGRTARQSHGESWDQWTPGRR
jgi:quinol monooxygenase YgiN